MTLASYRLSEARAALQAAGITRGAVCIVHVSLLQLGRLVDKTGSLPQDWLHLLQEQVGPEGTLILPAFTYSYCRHEVFDPLTTMSSVNLLANYAISQHLGYRTLDPNFSYLILPGNESSAQQVAAYRFSNVSFDFEPSIVALAYQLSAEPRLVSVRTEHEFDRFTCYHLVDQELGRPCRFMKRFVGQTKLAGQLKTTASYFYCRLNVPNSSFDFVPLAAPLTARLGAGGIYSVPLRTKLEHYRAGIAADPWWAVQGPALSADQCQALLAQEHDVCAPQDIVRTYQPPIKL